MSKEMAAVLIFGGFAVFALIMFVLERRAVARRKAARGGQLFGRDVDIDTAADDEQQQPKKKKKAGKRKRLFSTKKRRREKNIITEDGEKATKKGKGKQISEA